MTATLRRYGAVVPVVALVLAGAGVLVGARVLPTGGIALLDKPAPTIAMLAIAVGVAALASLAMVHVRVGSGTVGLAWGESAIVILCVLLPAAWIPAATLVGVGLARALEALRPARRDEVARSVWSTGVLTLAATAGTVAANLLMSTAGQRDITPRLAVALCLAAAGYAVTGATMISWSLARRHGEAFWPVFLRAYGSKLPMVIGNVAVGLAVVALIGMNARWLILLPPALWLLHRAYAYRMRLHDERRNWQTFADATRQLNRLDEEDAASAGIRGALRLFGGGRAQLSVIAPDGQVRGYRGETDGEVVACAPTPEDGSPTVGRELVVGGVRVGDLHLWLTHTHGMRSRDRLMFAAYADALAAALHDAATHRELRSMIERSASDLARDPLTGLPNRSAFFSQGDALLRELASDTPVALLLLDIDDFKDVNDTLGHGAGDELLRITASRLAAELPTGPASGSGTGELLARLDGDEFAVLLPALALVDCHRPELRGVDFSERLTYALVRAHALAGGVAAPSEVAGVQLSIEASVGVAVAAAGTVDLTELLRRASIAMYQAKRGGSSVSWYEPARDLVSTDRLSLLAEVREALAVDDQLTLAMQPAMRLHGGGVTGVEALVRWRHPRRGDLLPADFVTVVERSELLGEFTRYILGRALAVAADWAADGLDVPVAVNLSPRSLLDPTLPEAVAALLVQHDVPPERLVLEITETVVMSELTVIDDVLSALRDMGVRLAVDDFGTGYSSLTFLTRVTVDEIKIDRSFVRRMVESEEVAAIVRTTIELAQGLGLRVVAEGVETAEQRAALTVLGCTSAQGYLFHPPMPPERLRELLLVMDSAKIVNLRQEDAS
jgi:diguanylate cyclase (GGDEF)-like protein